MSSNLIVGIFRVSCEKAFREIEIDVMRAKDSEEEPLNFRWADDQFIAVQKRPCNLRFA